jgi:hypothetical protein
MGDIAANLALIGFVASNVAQEGAGGSEAREGFAPGRRGLPRVCCAAGKMVGGREAGEGRSKQATWGWAHFCA